MEAVWEKRRKKMAVPWQVMNKIRSELRERLGWKSDQGKKHDTGEDVFIDETFFTFDRDTQQIVSNRKFRDENTGEYFHLIFDSMGNLIKKHRD